MSPLQPDRSVGENGVFDRVGAMTLAAYRVGDEVFVHADGREYRIETLRAALRRGWLRSRLVLQQESRVIVDLRYPGKWTEIPHRMDAFAYQDDELDFALFVARRINQPHRQPRLFMTS